MRSEEFPEKEASVPEDSPGQGTAIILVEPKRGENIGAAARAMKNFGLRDLRVVNPLNGWPDEKAIVVSARARDVLESAQVFPSLEAALADRQYVYATTGRRRNPVVHLEQVTVRKLKEHSATKQQVGVLFGREDQGLFNRELALANALLTIDSDPEFYSLNLGQAVVVVCYELYHSPSRAWGKKLRRCQQQDLEGLMRELFQHLEERGFWDDEGREYLQLKLRGLVNRVADLTSSDVGVLRGVVRSLAGPQAGKDLLLQKTGTDAGVQGAAAKVQEPHDGKCGDPES